MAFVKVSCIDGAIEKLSLFFVDGFDGLNSAKFFEPLAY